MPRNRVRKTDRGLTDISQYKQAYEEVLNGKSARAAAKDFGLCHVSLLRYKRKREEHDADSDSHSTVVMGYNSAKKVFSNEQETRIVDYINKATDMYGGSLSPKEIRRLAFELARKQKVSCPKSWILNEIAGEDWFSAFIKRHPNLATNNCELTNNIPINLNGNELKEFYDIMRKIMEHDQFAIGNNCEKDISKKRYKV